MKKTSLILIVAALTMFGCVYKAPLAKKQKVKIDDSVLGAWQMVDEASKTAGNLLVLEYTDTEYLVSYKNEDATMFFRGYPIKVEGVSCVQLQLVGTGEGSIKQEDRKYNVISYTAAKDALTIKLLNTEVVDPNLGTTEELKAAFKTNKDNAKLFSDPVKFTKAKAK